MQRLETKGRVRALQLLYAWDLLGHPPLETVVIGLARLFGRLPPGFARAAMLADRTVAGLPEFDARVEHAAEHWRLERLGVIERNVLRLALAELALGEAPPRVVIDEAVKLAQWFAGPKAPAFVNGVLDTLARDAGVL
ncbi:MAG TPA: transcription antitermination factor NusB [Gemmatimonadales bacterium]|nr:transcription antitermination factor NusB [Gemmatimonadales bacterium]